MAPRISLEYVQRGFIYRDKVRNRNSALVRALRAINTHKTDYTHTHTHTTSHKHACKTHVEEEKEYGRGNREAVEMEALLTGLVLGLPLH